MLRARESEFLRWLALGLRNPEIAEPLTISPRTASPHLRSIFATLDMTTWLGEGDPSVRILI